MKQRGKQMDMSAAALPPRYIPINENDRKHPMFPKYMEWRALCSKLMIEANTFKNWLCQYEFQKECDDWCKHPEYKNFMKWMINNQGGARGSKSFPENFKYWLTGGRW